MSAQVTKLLLQAVVAQQLRIRALEIANRTAGREMPKIEMDKETQALLDNIMAALEAETEVAPAAKIETPVKVKAPKLPAPVVIKVLEAKAPAKTPRLKVADMTMEQLRARAEKLGGKPDRIVAGKSGTARTIALRNWIIRKQKALAAAK